jgi:hypothetical protein
MYIFIISKVQESFTTCKWCVIHMTYKTKVLFMIKNYNQKTLTYIGKNWNYDNFSRWNAKSNKCLHLKKIHSYLKKSDIKNVMY